MKKKEAPLYTRVCFTPKKCIQAELAYTEKQKAKGLMFRDKLEKDHGMLFIFQKDGFWSFWMKNTKIPLDMIWINSDKVIVSIIENVQPCEKEPCRTYVSMKKAQYVLEIGAGMAKKYGLKVGERVQFTLPEQVKKFLKNQASGGDM